MLDTEVPSARVRIDPTNVSIGRVCDNRATYKYSWLSELVTFRAFSTCVCIVIGFVIALAQVARPGGAAGVWRGRRYWAGWFHQYVTRIE